DLCFVGQGDYRDFLRKSNPSSMNPGPIVDLDGKSLGEHPGLADFTIGQRKGLGISSPEPLYVVRKDLKNNTLIVGSKEYLGQGKFYVDNINWISGEAPADSISANVKIRYKSREVPSIITLINSTTVSIQLDSNLPDITPGQAAVFYQNDVCLGGGIIRSD
ncbi:MAG: tRNA 2-thiouridine(34) synthase MnmA, partial [Anaerolineales bacterium]|nr:tRNA 2-thiouridine(34) synthase MnmA [Anaerolineales bacterium]